ncbi:MAG: hypothetical protein WC564_04120 [Patescibacteria group bacterium]
MTTKKIKKSSSVASLFLLGARLAGLAATAYFFLGPNGKKNQKYAKSWAIKMKADVIEKLEMSREISEAAYHKIIDAIAVKYGKVKNNNPAEVQELAQDLKKHWKTISGSVQKLVKKDVAVKSKKSV